MKLGNAAGAKSERRDGKPSLQGRAALHLQRLLPHARIVYVSATGASRPESLAYAERLGLWGSIDRPSPTREAFVHAVETGGIAAMEVVARDLKALGLYCARLMSLEGVEVDPLHHELTPEQIRIYDAYASAFHIIHVNLDAALKATNITGESALTTATRRRPQRAPSRATSSASSTISSPR